MLTRTVSRPRHAIKHTCTRHDDSMTIRMEHIMSHTTDACVFVIGPSGGTHFVCPRTGRT
jgi:hypothetical protein